MEDGWWRSGVGY
uniref:Uncharacterized protein n=1 Tax=Arundo donax TaxID=35708 RepID=A0A0A9AUB2_ARUDO